MPFIKIPSALLTHESLLTWIRLNWPSQVVLSTGMSTLSQIERALELLPPKPYLMACTSVYPCPVDLLNLRSMQALRSKFDCPTGYSSHAVSPVPALVAAALGADMVEVHVTLDRTMWGTDHAASLEPDALRWLVKHIRTLPLMMGDGKKVIYSEERPALTRLRGTTV